MKTPNKSDYQIVCDDENGAKRIDPNALVSYFLATHRVVHYHEKNFAIYDEKDGVWHEYTTNEMKRQVAGVLSRNHLKLWSPKLKDRVMELLDVVVKKCWEDANKTTLLNLENGVLDLSRGTIFSHSSKYFFMTKADYAYDPDADCPNFKKYLDVVCCGDQDLILTIHEMLGYCLTGDTSAQILFFLYGDGENGKSVLCSLIKELVGYNDFASLTPKEIEKEFSRERLDGKKVLLIPDLRKEDAYGLKGAEIKKLVGGDIVSAERKYGSSFEFKSQLKIVLSSNFPAELFYDSTHGGKRRFFVLPFLHRITESERDTRLLEKLIEERSGILNLACQGYKRLLKNKYAFSYSGYEVKEDVLRQEDPVGSYINECIEICKGACVLNRILKEDFERYCTEYGISAKMPHTKIFHERLNSHFKRKLESYVSNGKRGLRDIKIKC